MAATYASLAEAKAEFDAGTSTVQDSRLLQYLRTVSARIDLEFAARRPFFMPYIETRQRQVISANVNAWENVFYLGWNILALTGVSQGSNPLTVGTNVNLWPSLLSPGRALQLAMGISWADYCQNSNTPFITITGTWGFHRDYPYAWLAVDALAAAITTTTALTFTVADVDGLDPYARTPRISAGNLLRIDDEFLEVVATDIATNTVTVIRGANGSTAATHAISAPVSVWQVEEAVKRACARQAAFLYARMGSYESGVINDLGIVNYPSDWLNEVRRIMQEYAYE